MPTALAISPHLDDAVFSAGGTLARLSRNGWHVIVATVFAASMPNPDGFALACQLDKGLAPDVDYMALRRDEDAEACAVLGAEPMWLPFAEAPHRGYESPAALFAGLREDDTIVDSIQPALAKLVGVQNPDIVLSPQAVGAHVDHIAVYMALRACRAPQWLWADFPYLVKPSSRASPFAGELTGLQREQCDLSLADIAAKAEAAIAYESQVGFQFGGPGRARTCIEAAGRTEFFLRTSRGPSVPGMMMRDA